ncbi:MAG: divalent-cation tolerance protein CutA [bacterium]
MMTGRGTEFRVALITAGSEEEGARIAKTLVERKLAACVNLVPGVRSIYAWKGKIEDERETLLVVKTRKDRFGALIEAVKAEHSYEVPEIISLSVAEGDERYLEWLADGTKPE